MKIILTGATGFVGEGVLLECLKDNRIEEVLSISRKTCGHQHPKLKELIVADLMDLQADDTRLHGYEAVFFCAGISSVGLSEAQFRPIAYDIPMHLAHVVQPKEAMTYIFVSGAGTGSSRQMWGRVKRQTEDELQQLGFRQVFNFRPAIMKPADGQIHMKFTDKVFGQCFGLAKLLKAGNTMTQVCLSMINATLHGYETPTIGVRDISRLSKN